LLFVFSWFGKFVALVYLDMLFLLLDLSLFTVMCLAKFISKLLKKLDWYSKGRDYV